MSSMSSGNRENEKGYHRPHDRYQCGLACVGERCAPGPDSQGKCQIELCTPSTRLAWWQRHLRAVVAMVGLCGLVVILSTSWHRDVLAPGPLTQAHAQILQGPEHANRCAACHDLGRLPALAWITPPHPMSSQLVSQDALCKKCHLAEMPELDRGTPHDLPLESLDRITQQVLARRATKREHLVSLSDLPTVKPASSVSSTVHWRTHDLSCSDCHREHQGTMHDLTKLSTQRCQSCHIEQFSGFAHGHPEFSDYPQPRPSHIAFNHLQHRDKHFAKENREFDCRTCHVQDGERGTVGKVFRSVSFESACASCHQKSLDNSLAEGLVVFQLPSIDRKRLLQSVSQQDAIRALQDWPEASSQVMDGKIAPVMELMLLGDPQNEPLLNAWDRIRDLSQVDLSKKQDVDLVIQLVLACRKLLQEIGDEGQRSIARRVERWNPEDRDSKLVSTSTLSARASSQAARMPNWNEALLQGVPPDLFRSAWTQWFEPQGVAGGLQGTNKTTSPKPNVVNDSNDLLSSNDSNPLAQDKPSASAKKVLKPMQHLPEGGWMIDQRRMAIVYIPRGHADPWLTAWTSLAAKARGVRYSEQQSEDQSSWVGGEQDRASLLAPGQDLLQIKQIGNCVECHDRLLHPVSAWNDAASFLPHWKIPRRRADVREATKFDHTPHLLIPSLVDCTRCHALNESKSEGADPTSHAAESRFVSAIAPSTRAQSFTANRSDDIHAEHAFRPMTKGQCSSCHRPNGAGDSCTQCHNYHVHDPIFRETRTIERAVHGNR
ncbi:MAG: hypothetical protein U0905_06475 [Pirellulales bacterium]